MSASASSPMIIDCLQYSLPERARFEEWRAGGVGAVHVTLAIWEDARETLRVIGAWNRLFEANTDLIALAGSARDIDRIAGSGRTAVIFGFQNTSPFEDDLDLVEIFHQLGVRIAQLTYNIANAVGCGCWEEGGLTRFFGRNVIAEMNRVGMLVDLSHCNDRTSYEALEVSSRPVVITHANPDGFVGREIELKHRNKSDALIRAVARQGGMIGLSMYPRISRGGSNATIEDFCDMVAYTVDLAGIEAVGLGTDFYTGHPPSVIDWWRAGRWARESPVKISPDFSRWPGWFTSPAQFGNVLDGLRSKGFAEEEVGKLAGGNWLRVFRTSFEPANT